MAEEQLDTLGAPIAVALRDLPDDEGAALLVALAQTATPAQRTALRAALGAADGEVAVVSEEYGRIHGLTQAQYDALSPPNPRTLYIIEG